MAATRPNPAEETRQPASLIGRDEMNLAEFPIGLLADRVPKGQKTLYFEDNHGRLTVTGSDAHGLPTATDTDVIVALLYLTKLRNGFSDEKVNFSRYELIKLLKWTDESWYYKRLEQSLKRWVGVSLYYDKCWWNNNLKRYTDAQMHIIETVEIIDDDAGGKVQQVGQSGLPLSYFARNRKFIESCQADNLRQLNLDEYFSLKSAIAKRLYRFLGKRFYRQGDWTFDLDEIAFDRVGLSRSYARNAGKIKEKLRPAIDELEAIGFLRPLARDERYGRVDRSRWTIRLARQSPPLVAPRQSAAPRGPGPPALVAELARRGVTKATAAELVAKHPAEVIRLKIDVFDWLLERQDKRVAQSPAGYLVTSINKDYATPKGFVSEAERRRREGSRQAKEREAAEGRRREREIERDERRWAERVEARRRSLTAEPLAEAEAAAIAEADEETRRILDDPAIGPFRKTPISRLVDERIGRLIRAEEEAAGPA